MNARKLEIFLDQQDSIARDLSDKLPKNHFLSIHYDEYLPNICRYPSNSIIPHIVAQKRCIPFSRIIQTVKKQRIYVHILFERPFTKEEKQRIDNTLTIGHNIEDHEIVYSINPVAFGAPKKQKIKNKK